jgi:glycosyltransferase involved in cell wall biosynthesis
MAEQPELTVVMPAYNERATIHAALERVLASPVEDLEIVIVDDGSTDGTRALLTQGVALDPRVRVILHPRNQGKGAALRTGFAEHPRATYVLVQDADLEYDPAGLPDAYWSPCSMNLADVVYGSTVPRCARTACSTTGTTVGNKHADDASATCSRT